MTTTPPQEQVLSRYPSVQAWLELLETWDVQQPRWMPMAVVLHITYCIAKGVRLSPSPRHWNRSRSTSVSCCLAKKVQ